MYGRHRGGGGGGGGTPRKIGWGFAARFPKPTLFMTKICDIRYPIYDLTFDQNPVSDQRYNKFPSSDQC